MKQHIISVRIPTDKLDPPARKRRQQHTVAIVAMLVLLAIPVTVVALTGSFHNKQTLKDISDLSVSENQMTATTQGTTSTTVSTQTSPTSLPTKPLYTAKTPLNTNSPNYLTPGARQPAYLDDAALIGDSITQGLGLYLTDWDARVFGARSLNPDSVFSEKVKIAGKSVTIVDAVKTAKPRKIYLMLGTNGIAWMNRDHMLSRLSALIDRFRKDLPGCTIIIEAIPPTSREKAKADKRFAPQKIDAYNAALLRLAEDKQVAFLDVNRLFRDADGYLPSKETPDGIHFYKANYLRWVELLNSCIPADSYPPVIRTTVQEKATTATTQSSSDTTGTANTTGTTGKTGTTGTTRATRATRAPVHAR